MKKFSACCLTLFPVESGVKKEVEDLPELDVPLAESDPGVPTVVPNYAKPGSVSLYCKKQYATLLAGCFECLTNDAIFMTSEN